MPVMQWAVFHQQDYIVYIEFFMSFLQGLKFPSNFYKTYLSLQVSEHVWSQGEVRRHTSYSWDRIWIHPYQGQDQAHTEN